MDVKSDSKNSSQFIKLTSVGKITSFAIRKAWFVVGKRVIKDAKKAIMKKPRSGRVYTLRTPGGRKRRHTASKPGESHANLTGQLKNATSWKLHGSDMEFGYGVVKRNAPPHGKWMEFGVKAKSGGWKIEPRPTLKNAIDANIKNAENDLARAVEESFK